MHNGSGGVFTPSGPIEAGFFVCSGDAESAATATFDRIAIGKPKLDYHSSWIGNTFSQDSTGHVSNSIRALWVEPDGTCYTNSSWDEAGEASKIYRNGKVVGSFRKENESLGNSFCGEGSITSDGVHTYLAAGRNIYMSDMLAHGSATRPVYFASGLWDEKRNVTSGMVVVKGELYVADSREDKIRVARAEFTPYYTAGNSSVNHATQAIDTSGVAHAAPAAVYQSQRECDHLPYRIPHLDPASVYTVRFHFAEYKFDQPGKRPMDVFAGGQRRQFDILEAAGAKYKAAVLDIANARTDKNGTLGVGLTRVRGSADGHIVVCGFEVLQADGKPAFALNCGGPQVGGFQSEVQEIPERAFAFVRPGPMTADKRGDLWIIQRANDFPAEVTPATKYPAALKCYHTDGTFTGRQISDVVNPTAVAYDPAADRLLVAENAPDQNIRIYGNLAAAPRYTGSFGIRGGIYAGKTPGLLFDPAAGGWARFYGLSGVGIDAQGRIYVSCNSSGTDLRAFTPDGHLVWMLNGLHFVDYADFDPDSDGSEVYCPFKHYTLDYAKTEPGSEWRYIAYNWNPLKYGPAHRPNCSSAVVRRVGPQRTLMLYTSGQGQLGYVGIYRFDGHVNVPAGRIQQVKGGNVEVWIDANGDGQETADEVTTCPRCGYIQSFAVDQRGDIWLACMGAPTLRHFFFHGLNEHGVPLYGTNPGSYEDIPFPGTGKKVNVWGQIARVVYDSQRDVMYLVGPARDRKADKDNPVVYLVRYDGWSQGNRTARWTITLPDPATDPNFMYTPPQPSGLAFHWMAFDVAVDKIFLAEMWGPIHVYDAATGKPDVILNAGPEVSGGNAWEDEQMGVRACKRSNGEYIILSENSGYRAKNNMFRWKPEAK